MTVNRRKIFAFDIDGTISQNGKVREEVHSLFKHIHFKNHPIVLVTKRTCHESQVILNQLATKVDLISFGGKVVSDSAHTKLWTCCKTLDVRRLLHSRVNCNVVLEGTDGWSVSNNGMLPIAKLILGLPLQEKLQWGEEFPVYRAIVKGRLEPEDCYQMFGDQIYISYWPSLPLTEIRTRNENKATGLEVYSGIVGTSDILAVGDDYNDISMFEIANESVAFIASPIEVRAAATVVVNNFDEVVTHIHDVIYG